MRNSSRFRSLLVIVPFIIILILTLIPSCGGGGGGGGSAPGPAPTTSPTSTSSPTPTPTSSPTSSPTPTPTFTGTPADNVEVLPDTAASQLEEIQGNVYYFNANATEVNNLKQGDIMVGAVNGGFLRKVVSVKRERDRIAVTTEDTTIEESFRETEKCGVSRTLSPDDVTSSRALKGVTLSRGDKGQFKLKFDKVYVEEGANIQLDGSVDINPSFNFWMQIRNFRLDYLSFDFSNVETADFTLTVDKSVSAGTEWEVATYYFTPIVFMAGPVPIVLVPELSVKVGMSVGVEGSFTASVNQQSNYNAGLEYNGSWSGKESFQNSFSYNQPSVSGNTSAKAYVKPTISLKLYTVAGPEAGVSGYLRMTANPNDSPWWSLYGGITADVGVAIEIFSNTVASYSTTVYEYEELIATSDSPTPTPTPSPSPSPSPTSSPSPTPTHTTSPSPSPSPSSSPSPSPSPGGATIIVTLVTDAEQATGQIYKDGVADGPPQQMVKEDGVFKTTFYGKSTGNRIISISGLGEGYSDVYDFARPITSGINEFTFTITKNRKK